MKSHFEPRPLFASTQVCVVQCVREMTVNAGHLAGRGVRGDEERPTVLAAPVQRGYAPRNRSRRTMTRRSC